MLSMGEVSKGTETYLSFSLIIFAKIQVIVHDIKKEQLTQSVFCKGEKGIAVNRMWMKAPVTHLEKN